MYLEYRLWAQKVPNIPVIKGFGHFSKYTYHLDTLLTAYLLIDFPHDL